MSTALYYHRARYYDPKAGRFLQHDPIPPRRDEMNPYFYVMNDPVGKADPAGLSYLIFDRTAGHIYLFDRNGFFAGSAAAGNNGPTRWPNGFFDYSHYNRHLESGPNDSFGSNGIFVFDVPGHSGMGVHSGQADKGGPTHPTNGCIRTTDEMTELIRELHMTDPLTGIDIY